MIKPGLVIYSGADYSNGSQGIPTLLLRAYMAWESNKSTGDMNTQT